MLSTTADTPRVNRKKQNFELSEGLTLQLNSCLAYAPRPHLICCSQAGMHGVSSEISNCDDLDSPGHRAIGSEQHPESLSGPGRRSGRQFVTEQVASLQIGRAQLLLATIPLAQCESQGSPSDTEF